MQEPNWEVPHIRVAAAVSLVPVDVHHTACACGVQTQSFPNMPFFPSREFVVCLSEPDAGDLLHLTRLRVSMGRGYVYVCNKFEVPEITWAMAVSILCLQESRLESIL